MKLSSKILYLLAFGTLGACAPIIALNEIDTQENISMDESLPQDPQMLSVITPYQASLEKEMNQVIAHSPEELTKSGDNSSLGNLFSDYTLDAARKWAKGKNMNVEAAVINIGGLRTTIGKGDVLLRHVFEVMPFENELVIVKFKGEELQGLFDYYAKNLRNNPVSGLLIETKGNDLVRAEIAGKKLDPSKDYYIATSDYLALGGDQMNFFSKGEMLLTGIKLRDAYIEELKENPNIIVPKDERLLFHQKPTK